MLTDVGVLKRELDSSKVDDDRMVGVAERGLIDGDTSLKVGNDSVATGDGVPESSSSTLEAECERRISAGMSRKPSRPV